MEIQSPDQQLDPIPPADIPLSSRPQRVPGNFSRLTASPFARSVAVLASGTIAAQAIPVLASPILTRLYSPAEFGLFQVFLALAICVSKAVCGTYEMALILPASAAVGKKLLGVAIHFAVLVSLVGSVFLLFSGSFVLHLLNAPELEGWIHLVPLLLLLMGLALSLTYFSIRAKHFDHIAKAKMLQAFSMVAVSIGLGLAGAPFWGLLLGNMVGWSVVAIFLFWRYRNDLPLKTLKWDRRSRAVAWRYREYPAFGAPGKLFNGLQLEMPVFFLSHFFPATIVGFYSVVNRVANAPLAFLSSSISQVNIREVVDLIHRGESVRPYLWRLSVVLGILTLIPSIILMVFAPDLFGWLFGSPWREAGLYARILMPSLAVRFVVSTVSTTLGATENNRLALIWQTSAFVVTGLVFVIFGPKSDPLVLLTVFTVTDIALYLYHYSLIWLAAGHPRNRSVRGAES